MQAVRGRPRSSDVDAAVRAAVLSLLAQYGYGGVSIEQVAARAGVAKASIYRRWPSKAEMVFAAAVHADVRPVPDSGSLREDLETLTERVIDLLAAPAAHQAMPGLLADLQQDQVLAERFRSTIIAAQRGLVADVLRRAHARGETTGAVDAIAVHAQLLGTVFAWLHLTAEEPPQGLAQQVVEALLAAIEAPTRAPAS